VNSVSHLSSSDSELRAFYELYNRQDYDRFERHIIVGGGYDRHRMMGVLPNATIDSRSMVLRHISQGQALPVTSSA
jgi:hypothetical protein